MTTKRKYNYQITYGPEEIILQGDTREIHDEAFKILIRFKCSSAPFFMKKNTSNEIILTHKQ